MALRSEALARDSIRYIQYNNFNDKARIFQ